VSNAFVVVLVLLGLKVVWNLGVPYLLIAAAARAEVSGARVGGVSLMPYAEVGLLALAVVLAWGLGRAWPLSAGGVATYGAAAIAASYAHIFVGSAIAGLRRGRSGRRPTALATSLTALYRHLDHAGAVPPALPVLLVEIPRGAAVDERGRVRVGRHALHTPPAFAARFDELLAAGLPWLNVSVYGTLGDRLIVAIETPAVAERPSERTSINYSGPIVAVRAAGWDVREVLAIEEPT
jgi:hypothetical protein